MLSRLRRQQDGWTLVTAMILMTIMSGIALSTYALVDTQVKQSATGRQRETAFNIAEAALNAQIFALSQNWPGVGAATNTNLRYLPCTQASTGVRCPNATTLTHLFSSPDTTPGMAWATSVRDNDTNATQNFYSDSLTANAANYDSNGDKKVWVRAQGSAKGKTRTVVALVHVEEQVESLPHAALISGRLDISNNGHKAIIDATGASSQSNLVAVRCTPALLELTPCLGHGLVGGLLTLLSTALADLNALLNFQIEPNVTQTGYTGGAALSAQALLRLKATAIANGTYYTTCPSDISGQVVYIESGNCSYTAHTVYNSEANPGFLIQATGSLYLAGTSEFYGVIYHPNLANTTGNAVQIQGDATVYGGVIVDGQATTVAGSSHLNIRLLDTAFDKIRSYGSAGLIQNTWREIKGS